MPENKIYSKSETLFSSDQWIYRKYIVAMFAHGDSCGKQEAASLVFKTSITKTCLYNFDPLKPHFYIVKLGFTGYTLFFLFLLKNIDCGTR